uniref:ASCH domain-containing protein n=1 Tax=Fervidicoccus fontis TaxID=683846 RepID=A0A7J3ZK48_9CREN
MSEDVKPKFLGRHLMLKERYAQAILSGKKKATIRLGVVKPKSREVLLHAGGRVVAKLYIKKFYHKRLKELDVQEARLEGLSSVRELRKELARIYGRLDPNTLVTVVVFDGVERIKAASDESRWGGLNPVDIARISLRADLELSEEEKRVLETLVRTRSIRQTAYLLYGGIEKRRLVRRVLRKVLRMLFEKGIIEQESKG